MKGDLFLWCMTALVGVPSLVAQSGESLLQSADRLRHPWPQVQVDVRVQDGSRHQIWRVQARENGDARVEGVSEKEKGRIVLVLGEEMWLRLPGSRRPIRITPQQRLMGPVSGADLARTKLAVDYQPGKVFQELYEGKAHLRLELNARKKSTSYPKAELWFDAQTLLPLRGVFFLASGQASKEIRFDAPISVLDRKLIPGLTLKDLKQGFICRIDFSAWKPVRNDTHAFQPGIENPSTP